MTTMMTQRPRPARGLRQWWHDLEHDARQRVVERTTHATIALFGVGSLVLCLVALRTI
ncbi:hypothetical protein [Nocardioides sp. SYSU DS0663]|uniref:hypothetical protein n=1 Tax=Nocardioides sp. SYSU DS0663 TaxID=3416445 RepID=UPI003F4C8D30